MLDNAAATLRPGASLIIHSDCGSCYRPMWIERMKQAELIRSMSKKDILQTIQPVKDSLADLKLNFFMVMVINWFLLITS